MEALEFDDEDDDEFYDEDDEDDSDDYYYDDIGTMKMKSTTMEIWSRFFCTFIIL